jgi:O-antigen ligase
MLFPWFYVLRKPEQREKWWVAFVLSLTALLLTYSRASWLAFLAGMFTIGYFLMHDRRLFKILATGGFLIAFYLLFVTITQNLGTGTVDQSSRQSLRDRLVESVSLYSWRQSYEGYGRFFFIINTPLTVVRNSPLFGVGPGNYGGGVAAALDNRRIYDVLHLPFGIQNAYGQIDNNWLSIWGETGTLGLIIWILLFVEIFRSANKVQAHSKDIIQKTIAQGLCGAVVALSVLGFFGPYFEFRTLMMYFWLVVGIALYYFREHHFSWNFLRE